MGSRAVTSTRRIFSPDPVRVNNTQLVRWIEMDRVNTEGQHTEQREKCKQQSWMGNILTWNDTNASSKASAKVLTEEVIKIRQKHSKAGGGDGWGPEQGKHIHVVLKKYFVVCSVFSNAYS